MTTQPENKIPTRGLNWGKEELQSLFLSSNSCSKRESEGVAAPEGGELNTRGMRRDLITCPSLSLPEGHALAM